MNFYSYGIFAKTGGQNQKSAILTLFLAHWLLKHALKPSKSKFFVAKVVSDFPYLKR